MIVACWFIHAVGFANVRLASIFGDRMVLQRQVEVPIWGTARKGEKITVSFAGQEVFTAANDIGNWMVRLTPLKEGGPYDLTAAGEDTVRLFDILIGEVWLCSGQSNMELAVEKTLNAQAEIAAAHYPMIRLFTVKRMVADSPQVNCLGKWSQCESVSVKTFSGVAYYFGRKLFQDLNVPIGLIHSSYGGTPAEAWMSKKALESDSEFQSINERWKHNLAEYPEKKKEYDAKREQLLKDWETKSEKAKTEGRAAPVRPKEPMGPGNRSTPSGLFNGMIAPLMPFAFKGVIWYQGEANAARAYQYRKLFPALIRDWRNNWGTELPFYFVQLPNINREPEPSRSGWAELRESQLMTLSLPKTAMVVTIDIGDPADLHPQNKQDVGFRLALLAEGLTYHKEIITFQCPIYQSFKLEDKCMRIYFDHATGLHAKEGKELKGFVIAGEDKLFVSAQAKIDGKEVVVWSEAVSKPASVRYAWADNPTCNLVNDANLPASPFRTDDWPEVTFFKK